ncbi:hypothetical protein KKI90_19085 [Xenorhabdus bovienii]|uniref:ATP nucleosidase Cap17-like N-terminal domain-containing protein n=1 Tax=Xenorhabdus bovienii TaxID=40576 RepID=A0AAJ1N120_XENBV|nr:hypothetical protein [Xenorhabdus bovienii]MDE1480158.1 hypothetical protein [Xenorhabdus bovienii]MDE1488345.1 hypothetical protein [Xenorhabdus bovienii]MDE1492687.1 hypothetical protein [Xenorhabdus bovienii]MDE1496871.1 hypothetical protein [Xenorhabdus bovienii]MDE9452464.1 hypothetical protein [Xenorhabdus bovienii]
MSGNFLSGRRVHISGSIPEQLEHASAEEVDRAREFIGKLVHELVRVGANFVIPIDAEKTRGCDGRAICFDWLVWGEVIKNLNHRPEGIPGPLIIAVKHHKNEDQIPEEHILSWDDFRGTRHVRIESAAHWNMASKRMEIQSRSGDVLITIGGSEGVLFLANLYHDAGKPVIPLNYRIGPVTTGSQKIFEYALASTHSERLFKTEDDRSSHDWINRLDFPNRMPSEERVRILIQLMQDLTPPTAFFVCLMNRAHADYVAVKNYYECVVKPVMEGKLGFRMIIVDGSQGYENAHVNQEVFNRLHRSRVVIADLTGSRPNCFLELGYALGRGLPTMILAKNDTELPFDIHTVSAHLWADEGEVADKKREFLNHWDSIKSRSSLVSTEPLMP